MLGMWSADSGAIIFSFSPMPLHKACLYYIVRALGSFSLLHDGRLEYMRFNKGLGEDFEVSICQIPNKDMRKKLKML